MSGEKGRGAGRLAHSVSALYLVRSLKGRKEMLHRRCNGSNLGLNFVAPRLADSGFHALLMQPLATAFQVANVLSDSFVHGAILTT